MADPLPLDERPTRPLWRNASFMLMWTSVAASGFGDRLIQLAAEPMLGVNEAGVSAAQINAQINFWFFLPYMLLTVVGGYLADLLPRKWIMFACDEGRGLVLLLALWMAADLTGGTAVAEQHHWKVALILICTGALAAIFNPARVATVPQIVPGRQLQPANAIIAVIATVSSLIGFAAGGIIINKAIQTGILVGALAYLVSGWFFVFMSVQHRPAGKPKDATGVLAQAAAAFGYLRNHKAARNLVFYNITFWAGAFVVMAALSALIKVHYGFDPEDESFLARKGTMMAMLGGGLMAGSLFVMWLRERRESANVALIALAISALCMLLLALNRSYTMGLFLTFWCGMFGGVFNICIDTLTQTIVPNHLRGRVFGLRALLNTSAAVIVNFAIWQLPNADNLMVPALLTLAVLLFIAAIYGLKMQITSGPLEDRRLNMLWKVTRMYTLIWHRLRWTGRHRMPMEGRLIIASNHTAAIDPFLIQSVLPRYVRWVMVTKNKYKLANYLWNAIQPICVDEGGNLREQMRKILDALDEESLVGIFPEGRLQRESRSLRPFKPGVSMMAKRSGASVLPVWISGTPQKRRMIWHFLCPSRSSVTIGEPISLDKDMSNDEFRTLLLERMLKLGRESAFADLSCPNCDYDLQATFDADHNDCPECGHVIWEVSFRETTTTITIKADDAEVDNKASEDNLDSKPDSNQDS